MMQSYLTPIETDAASLAVDAIAEVGPGGHFFGADHTMDRYETAFYQPLVANWDSWTTWQDRGSVDAAGRAAALWPQLLAGYDAPDLDPGRAEALDAYVARRKAEGGAPMN
jgi:trimethylamine--corrinoid protein Co-methyltransferase